MRNTLVLHDSWLQVTSRLKSSSRMTLQTLAAHRS
jgi:hypothetical protein